MVVFADIQMRTTYSFKDFDCHMLNLLLIYNCREKKTSFFTEKKSGIPTSYVVASWYNREFLC